MDQARLGVVVEENDFVVDSGEEHLVLHLPGLAVPRHQPQVLVVDVRGEHELFILSAFLEEVDGPLAQGSHVDR